MIGLGALTFMTTVVGVGRGHRRDPGDVVAVVRLLVGAVEDPVERVSHVRRGERDAVRPLHAGADRVRPGGVVGRLLPRGGQRRARARSPSGCSRSGCRTSSPQASYASALMPVNGLRESTSSVMPTVKVALALSGAGSTLVSGWYGARRGGRRRRREERRRTDHRGGHGPTTTRRASVPPCPNPERPRLPLVHEVVRDLHGVRRVDAYDWLSDRTSAATSEYLEAEQSLLRHVDRALATPPYRAVQGNETPCRPD